MPHWKLTLCYNGSHFHGWQIQPGLQTVQGTLAAALEQITGEAVLPQGAGRTDAGVHALAQVASVTLEATMPSANLQRALNARMPPSVRITAAERVSESFHARHSARRKTYEYRIFERRAVGAEGNSAQGEGADRICSPFLAPFVWDCRWPLRLNLLRDAAAMLAGTRDFSAMAAAAREPREVGDTAQERQQSLPNPLKTIHSSAWTPRDGLLVYRICGSGFLHHMVRNLVGTMVDIGRGSLKLEDLPKILDSRDRSQAGPTAPAGGLFMVGVEYEPLPVASATHTPGAAV